MLHNCLCLLSCSHLLASQSLELNFKTSTGTFLNEDTTTEFRVFYELPKQQLTFITPNPQLSGQTRIARFGVLFKLSGKDKEWGDSWIVSLPQDSQVNLSQALTDKITGELKLKTEPGKYDFYIKVWDLYSKKIGEKKSKVIVDSILRAQNSTSPQIISSRRFVDNKFLIFEIYNFSSKPFDLIYTIKNFNDTVPIDTSRFINPIKLELPIDSLGYGVHIITLSVGTLKITDTIEINVPVKLKNYEERVKQLHYIAKAQEIKALLEVPIASRDSSLQEFWKKKEAEIAPLPSGSGIEEEYYRRVDYANEHFSAVRKGWQTDRGRIYILLGEPDAIDSHPFEIDGFPYEIWSYYFRRVELIFVDKKGFGDYELQTPYWDTRIYFK